MGKDYSKFERFIFVCNGKKCKSDAKGLQKAFQAALKDEGLNKQAKVIKTKCTGRCKEAPVAIVGQAWLGHVKEEDAPKLVKKHLT